MSCICAIDPGYGGGIAFYRDNKTVLSIDMPRENKDVWDYLNYLKDTYGPFVLFIEKVQMWQSDSQGNTGKQFRIAKMLSNYDSLIALIEVNNIPLIEVAAVTWQKGLQLYFPAEKKKLDPGKYKQFRKNQYKRFAKKKFPSKKPTLKTADALCILWFGIERVSLSPNWVKNSIKNPSALSLFKS